MRKETRPARRLPAMLALAFLLCPSALLAFGNLQPLPQPGCCLAGAWSGAITETAGPACKDPAAGAEFTLALTQPTRCSRAVGGSWAGRDGAGRAFAGTGKPDSGGCCLLEGEVADAGGPAGSLAVSVTICEKAGTLAGTGVARSVSGEPPSRRVCEGTVRLEREAAR